jgi:hypothetical protein
MIRVFMRQDHSCNQQQKAGVSEEKRRNLLLSSWHKKAQVCIESCLAPNYAGSNSCCETVKVFISLPA